MSIKPVNSFTLGVPLRDSIDSRSSMRLLLADALTMEPPTRPDELTDYVVSMFVYMLNENRHEVP